MLVYSRTKCNGSSKQHKSWITAPAVCCFFSLQFWGMFLQNEAFRKERQTVWKLLTAPSCYILQQVALYCMLLGICSNKSVILLQREKWPSWVSFFPFSKWTQGFICRKWKWWSSFWKKNKNHAQPNKTQPNQPKKVTMQQTSLTAVWQTAYLQLVKCKFIVYKQVYIVQNSFIK